MTHLHRAISQSGDLVILWLDRAQAVLVPQRAFANKERNRTPRNRCANARKRVLWQVVDGPEEWIGTKVSWELRQEGDYTVILFKHQGWKEPVEFMHHCSTKWAVFLMSLKSLLETGKGAPWPNDTEIGNWD